MGREGREMGGVEESLLHMGRWEVATGRTGPQ